MNYMYYKKKKIKNGNKVGKSLRRTFPMKNIADTAKS